MSLDDDLAAWAATVRLTDADAEVIFRRIVLTGATAPAPAPASASAQVPPAGRTRRARREHTFAAFPATAFPATAFPAAPASATLSSATSAPAGLAPTWWRDYTRDFTARMVTATRPVRVAA